MKQSYLSSKGQEITLNLRWLVFRESTCEILSQNGIK